MSINKNFIPTELITFFTGQKNYNFFLNFCNKIKQDIIIDLANVKHCDSAGLAFLLEAKRICYGLNLTCKIINTPDSVTDLAEFYGIKDLF